MAPPLGFTCSPCPVTPSSRKEPAAPGREGLLARPRDFPESGFRAAPATSSTPVPDHPHDARWHAGEAMPRIRARGVRPAASPRLRSRNERAAASFTSRKRCRGHVRPRARWLQLSQLLERSVRGVLIAGNGNGSPFVDGDGHGYQPSLKAPSPCADRARCCDRSANASCRRGRTL